MSYDISSLYLKSNSIPTDFIKFGNFTINLFSMNAVEKLPIYFMLSKCQRTVIILQFLDNIINNDNKILVGTIYRWFRYNKGLFELLNNPSLWTNIKLQVSFKNIVDLTKCRIKTNVYLKKDYFDNYPYHKALPSLLYHLTHEANEANEANDVNDANGMNEVNEEFNEIPIISYKSIVNNNISIDIDTTVYKRQLYPYQLENVSWLSNMENSIIQDKLQFNSFLLENQDQFANYLTCFNKYLVISRTTRSKIKYDNFKTFSLKAKGGVLADNVGLGKTVSFIGLIAKSNTSNNIKKSNNVNNTSLIICPRRLCYQWLEEIEATSYLKTKIISTISQFNKVTKQDINKLDIVIIPYSFLNNPKYLTAIKDKDKDTFNFESYHWKRIILDEGHEYINSSQVRKKKSACFIRNSLENLTSDFRWISSGTPYASIDDFWKIIRFLCPAYKTLFDKIWSIQHIKKDLTNNLFRRHTSESLNNEIYIPNPHRETTFLHQNNIERVIYNSVIGDPDKMIQLCSHILVSDQYLNILGNKSLSLNEIHRKMTKYYLEKINHLEQQLTGLVGINNEKLVTKENDFRQLLDNYRSKYNIFNSISDKLQETKSCPICLDLLETTNKLVTDCGHFLCISCASSLFKGNWKNTSKCPICRQDISGENLKLISQDNCLIPKINKWGTKMANLIFYLNDILNNKQMNNRVIIFSQWDNMLKLVAEVLEEYNIKYLFLNGSIHVVTNRIKKFRQDISIRVVLLSSDRAVSGLNLTEATHIVLLDTLNTTPKRAKQIEDQAIGRSARLGQDKQIIIKRFIMHDTIEYDYYLRNRLVNKVEG